MTLTAVIVDDEPIARMRLKRLLTGLGIEIVAEGENGRDAISILDAMPANLLFMDIHMPLLNGLEAAEELGRSGRSLPAIIFCTAFDEHAVRAFKTNAIAYLLKPIQSADLEHAIAKAERLSDSQIKSLHKQIGAEKVIPINFQGALQKTPINEFVCFTAEGKNIFAKLVSGEEIYIDKTLKSLEQEFPDHLFRVHRATLVNRNHVYRLVRASAGNVTLELGDQLHKVKVSRRHLAEVKKCFE